MSDHKNPKLKNLLVKNNSPNDKACVLCKSTNHFFLVKCNLFLKQNEDDKYLTAKKINFFFKFLGSSNHNVSQCFLKRICKCCSQNNYLLYH